MNYFGGSSCGCPNVGCGMPTCGCPVPTCGCTGSGVGSSYAIILVLFILLVIIIGARFIS